MPKRKIKVVKRASKISHPVESFPMESAPVSYTPETVMPQVPAKKKISTTMGLVVLILVVAGVFFLKKGYLVSAVVNGKPIFTWTLTGAMMDRYGKQTLEGMITEELITQEAVKSNISITPDEVKSRESDLVKSLGADVKIEDLLKYQGITQNDFDNQIKLQIAVEKILGKDVNFSDAELNNFIATSSAMLTATESAAQKEEARKILTEQAVSAKIQPWLQDLKNKAKILRMQ